MAQLLAYVPYPFAAALVDHPGRNPVGREQRFEAVTLFADISGFTGLSEELARHGRGGTEALTVLLNTYFDTMISLIDAYGGMVGTFGGDSLAVLFPIDAARWDGGIPGDPADERRATARRAVACAGAMQAAMERYQAIPTIAGTFRLAMKIGLGIGRVLCTTVGDPSSRLVYLIAGGALDRCAESERHAGEGEIVAHARLLDLVDSRLIDRADDGFGWLAVPDQPIGNPWGEVAPSPLPPLAESILPGDHPTLVLLRSHLHPAIVRRLETGTELINEHRTVTVVFVRFQAFDYDRDHAVGDKLQAYLGDVIRIVKSYGGHLQQVDIGDKGSKYLVLFGAPVTHENDPERALRCAIDLREAARQAGIPTAAGVNLGSVYAGLVGAASRQEYTVIGDAVNLAARLMQAAADDQIVASQAVAQTASPVFDWQPMDPLPVKGRAEPVEAAGLLGLAEQLAIRLQEPQYSLPLVGRAEELAHVARTIDAVTAGQGRIIGLTGAAGMGKSRLTAEIIRTAEAAGLTSYRGECQSYSVHTPYAAWQPTWRAFFALEADWSPDVQRRVLEMQLSLIDPALVVRLPLLGRVFQLAWPDNDLTRGFDSQLRKESCENLLIDCLRSRARATPILIILEDCQWIDSLSQDLLEAMGRAIAHLPVLLVAVFRPLEPERAASFRITGLPQYSQIELGDLSPAEAERLIANKLAQLTGGAPLIVGALPAALVEQVTARAQGNPFYLEELLNYLHEQGDAEDGLLPASLQSLILSRIDQLSEHQQLTLKVASIIGRLFKAPWLWHFYPPLGGAAQVSHDLAALNQLDLTLLETPEPELIYLFKHIVTHEVAYESMAYSTRTHLHELFAQFVERTASNPAQYVDLLAYHYGQSQNAAKQREYLRRAGESAQAAYANDAAINYYRRLLPLLPQREQIPILLRVAQILELIGAWDEAAASLREGAALAGDPAWVAGGQPSEMGQFRYVMGRLLRKRGEYAAALAALNEAREAFAGLGDLPQLSQTLAEIGHVYRLQGNHQASGVFFNQSLDLRRHDGDKAAIADSLGNLGITAYAQGDYRTATDYHQAALALRREIGDKLGIAVSLNGLGIAAYAEAAYDAAATFFGQSLALRREVGDKLGITNCLNNLGVVAYERGDYPAARRLYEESLALRREIGNKGGIANSLNNLGFAALREGEADQAGVYLRESLDLHAELGNEQGVAEVMAGLAGIAAARGDAGQLPGTRGPTDGWRLAARLCGAIDRLLISINSVLEPTERQAYDEALEGARAALAEDDFAAAWAEGQSMPLSLVIAESVASLVPLAA